MDRRTSRRHKRRHVMHISEEGSNTNFSGASDSSARTPRQESIEVLSDDEVDHDIEITGSTGTTLHPSVNRTFQEPTQPAHSDNPPIIVDDDIHIIEERHNPAVPQDAQDVVSTPIGIFDISTARNQNARSRNTRTRIREDPVSHRLRARDAQPIRPARVRGPRRGLGVEHTYRNLMASIPSFAHLNRYLSWNQSEQGAAAFIAALQERGNQYFGLPDQVENSIMQRIERENESELDSRFQREVAFNRKALTAKQETSNQEVRGYTNDIKSGSHLGCELCGTILGRGIPAEFAADPSYNENYEKHAKELRVQSPWICVGQLTQADRDLLRRVFINKCGHAYCGRCVKNIGNRPRRKRGSAPVSVPNMNPLLYAPAKCPALECRKQFTTKSFIEIYF